MILGDSGELIRDSMCDHFIGFSGESRVDDAEEGEDAGFGLRYVLRKESELVAAE